MFFFFFSSRRRHTRSLRDWSSDVCSSDLREVVREILLAAISNPAGIVAALGEPKRAGVQVLHQSPTLTIMHVAWRSEERRVGKECRSRWSTDHEKKKERK